MSDVLQANRRGDSPVLMEPKRSASAAASAAIGRTSRPRLAIISTYDTLCGIAGYTHRLESYLSDRFDVEVLPLNQVYLKSERPRGMRLGDRHIGEIAQSLGQYDFVNIQYEPGTLASMPHLAYRRFRRLVQAAPALSVTFHTFQPSDQFPFWPIVKHAVRFRVRSAMDEVMDWHRSHWIGGKVFRLLQRQQKKKPVSVIVHTPREAEFLQVEYGMSNVQHHPLAFLTDEDVAVAKREASRSNFPELAALPKNAKIIGVFGFISAYKGTAAAIRALRHLPEEYHLAIFGGIHPNEIKQREEINSYLYRVLEEVNGAPPFRTDQPPAGAGAGSATKPTSSLSSRVHFLGSLDDAAFIRGMCLCDATVFPYLEVGQTSSGPISMAIELGCRVIAARNLLFMQLAKYHPHRMDFFDIGNHQELAARILYPQASRNVPAKYSYRTNAEVYWAAHQKPGVLVEPR